MIIVFRTKAPFGKNQSAFASSPAREITKIEFTDGDKRLLLTRENEKWLVNGKYDARKGGTSYITGILTEMKIKSPVSSELFEKEITAKGIKPVLVKVYEGARTLKEFYVYKTTSNKYGNIMKIRLHSKPFIVYLPGFEGDVGSVFVPDELYWRPFIIFNLLPSEISSVTFENKADPGSSFGIASSAGGYRMSDSGQNISGWDTSRVRRYISYFAHIPFEAWAFELSESEKKRMEISGPHYVISVVKSDGSSVKLTLWDRHPEGGAETDSDRLLGKTTSSDEFFIVRYFDIDPVIKKRSYFFSQ